MVSDGRAGRAERLLRDHGVAGARVRVGGHEREIAVLSVPATDWERLLGEEGAVVVAAVKALGFRYVALDLAPEPEGA